MFLKQIRSISRPASIHWSRAAAASVPRVQAAGFATEEAPKVHFKISPTAHPLLDKKDNQVGMTLPQFHIGVPPNTPYRAVRAR